MAGDLNGCQIVGTITLAVSPPAAAFILLYSLIRYMREVKLCVFSHVTKLGLFILYKTVYRQCHHRARNY